MELPSTSWTVAAWLSNARGDRDIAQLLAGVLLGSATGADDLAAMRELAQLSPVDLAVRLRAGGIEDAVAGVLHLKLLVSTHVPTSWPSVWGCPPSFCHSL